MPETPLIFPLTDNFNSWEIFDQQKDDCHRLLDGADTEFGAIKKVFDLRAGPEDFKRRKDTIERNKKDIQVETKIVSFHVYYVSIRCRP